MKSVSILLIFVFLLIPLSEVECLISAKVDKITGAPIVKRDNKNVLLTKDMEINENEEVESGSGDMIVLKLSTGEEIVVFQNSRVKISSENIDKKRNFKIFHDKGLLWMQIPKINISEKINVVTPNATIGVRGTAFSSFIKTLEESEFCVCIGEIEIETKDSKVNAKKGEITSTMSNGKIKEPSFDMSVLQNPPEKKMECLTCHQGGYSRDNIYSRK